MTTASSKRETEETTFMLRLSDDRIFDPTLTPTGDLCCPICFNDDLSVWADDGEAELADWFDCQISMGGCGTTGALVQPSNVDVTLNGVPWS